MQLEQVDRFDAQVLAAPVGELREVLVVVARRFVWIKAAAGFCGDDHVLAGLVLVEHARDVAFAPTVAVDVGSVEKGNSGVQCGADRLLTFFVGHVAPVGTDLPGAEPDLADFVSRATEVAVVHSRPA